MDSAMIQAQIRQNSLEVSDYLADLNKWEKSVKKKDKSLLAKKRKVASTKIRNTTTIPLRVSSFWVFQLVKEDCSVWLYLNSFFNFPAIRL